ncbi:MAG TPA: amino acid racemase [Vicinamibacteria bacterium]|nr:amino acid racemase [Vicinamibacteria bacterium]
MLHIGILAHSADGAALCFLEMCRESARRLGAHRHPEITLSILPMGTVLEAYDRKDFPALTAYLGRTGQRLKDAGCDFFVCPDNTAHIAFEAPGAHFPLPGLHIAEIVARQAKTDGRRCVGLLGTRWTMEGPVYPGAFTRAGLELRVPPKADRDRADTIIFDELCQGVILEASRTEYVGFIQRLADEGCDAVALSCTEIPLLVTPEVSPLPTLDSTRLLAREAVAVALGEAPVPAWHGGPIE